MALEDTGRVGKSLGQPADSRRIWRVLRRVRQGTQILSFLLFLYLLVQSWQSGITTGLTGLFFRLDPLSAIAAMVAGRVWISRMALALVTLGLTIVLGRVWCGWLCPLGSLLEWLRFPSAVRLSSTLNHPRWRRVKYLILFAILATALFGGLPLLVIDPITLLTRGLTISVLPSLNYAIVESEQVLYQIPFMRPVVNWFETTLRSSVFPCAQPVFAMNTFIFALLLSVVVLNIFADRFWCRYLCPLGGLLGLLSKVSFLRPVIGSQCNRCGRCVGDCQMDAIGTQQGYEIVPSECIVCLDCLANCPEGGIIFSIPGRPVAEPDYDPERRQLLVGLGAGAMGMALLGTGAKVAQPAPRLIRPPGVFDEDAFLSQCIRCSECMQVCTTFGLQPVLFESGLQGLWSPQLVSRLGYCDYSCNACGQVCPTGAIPPLDLETKRQQVMGMAVIDRNRCLPWAYDIPCIVCEEMCPIPDKAIRLVEAAVIGPEGEELVLQRPYVVLDMCIGCGICEYHCPMTAQSAIQVQRR